MLAAATERRLVWPKLAAQDVKGVQAHCCAAEYSRYPPFFLVVSIKLIHKNVARPPAEFHVDGLSVGSVLVYDTLRINKRQ
jgi:hypothetical protein